MTQMVGHGLVTSALFLVAGLFHDRTASDEIGALAPRRAPGGPIGDRRERGLLR